MSFTLLDSLSPYKYREKVAKTLPMGHLRDLWVLFSQVIKTRSIDRRGTSQREEERRKNTERRERERRGYNRYRLSSHLDNERYTFCAINAEGKECARGALVTIIIVHGLRGYGWLYILLAEFFRRQNYNVIIVDLPGHGNSKGERCRIYDIRYSDECIRSAIVAGAALSLNTPVVFIDFSMGALDVLYYLLNGAPKHIKHNVIGVASLGMPLNVTKEVPLWKLFLAPILGYFLPWVKIKELSMNKENIHHEIEVSERIWNDPLIYKGPLTAGTGYIILKKAQNVSIHLENGEFPFSTFYGRGEFDTVAQEEHYKQVGITVINYPGRKHELLQGSGAQEVVDDLDVWIKEVVLPSWPLTKQKRILSKTFFRKLVKREKERETATD